VCQAAWPLRQQVGREGDVFGGDAVAIERRQREHLVVDGDAGDAVSELDDDARELVGGNRRQAIDGPAELVASDRCRADSNQHFACLRPRHVKLLVDKATPVQADGSHHAHRRIYLTRKNLAKKRE
jgi:hypothetical protein